MRSDTRGYTDNEGWRKSLFRRYSTVLLTVALATGCHSALFQTANIRDGVDATVGITRVRAADNPDISDYSIFVKGEIGREARQHRFGYSFSLTFISPFKNKYRDLLMKQEIDLGSFPNEWAGVLPEVKIQFPRRLPVDLALDFRLMAVYPERVALLASRTLSDRFTLYGGFYYAAVGRLAAIGAELNLTPEVSLMVERSQWLSEHDYPSGSTDAGRREPYSFGIALSYHLPRQAKEHDSEKYATASGSELEN